MGNTSTENYESISNAIQLVASQIGKHIGGSFGQAYATFLTGQNSWVAGVSDLATKVQNGTATSEDFADVASKTASTLAGFGVLTGTAASWTLTAAGATGIALWAWKNHESVTENIYDGLEKIKELTVDHCGVTPPESVGMAQSFPYWTASYPSEYWDTDCDDDLPKGTVIVEPMTPSPSMDGTDYNQDGTSYQ